MASDEAEAIGAARPLQPTRDLRIEQALELAARGLVAYGWASLVAAGLVLIATVVIAIRLDASSHRLLDRVAQVTDTLDRTATALDDGVASTQRFGTTLDQLGPTLQRTTSSLRSGAATLDQLAATADEVALLGQRPFANLSTSLGATATELQGLADAVDADAGSLDASKAAVARLSTSLPPVATSLRTMRSDLEPDVRGLLDDLWRLVPLAGAALTLLVGIPGVGALLLGRRLMSALGA